MRSSMRWVRGVRGALLVAMVVSALAPSPHAHAQEACATTADVVDADETPSEHGSAPSGEEPTSRPPSIDVALAPAPATSGPTVDPSTTDDAMLARPAARPRASRADPLPVILGVGGAVVVGAIVLVVILVSTQAATPAGPINTPFEQAVLRF